MKGKNLNKILKKAKYISENRMISDNGFYAVSKKILIGLKKQRKYILENPLTPKDLIWNCNDNNVQVMYESEPSEYKWTRSEEEIYKSIDNMLNMKWPHEKKKTE